jgi:hypothetical protein
MMGKQINFYMTGADEQVFLAFVRSDRNVAVFKSVVPSKEIPSLQELPIQGERFWFSIRLWDRDHSPPPVLRYVGRQGYYSVDDIESEVIQFDRCGLDEGRLVRGRIWAEMTGWRHDDPAILVKKSKDFSRWFNRIATWIKRHSVRNAVGDYVLPGALEFSKRGGQMCQAVFAGGKAIPACPTDAEVDQAMKSVRTYRHPI